MKYNFINKIMDGEFSLREDFRQTGKDLWNFCEGIDKHKLKILIPAAIILTISSAYSAKEKLSQYMRSPRYGFDFQSIKFRKGICVRFYDDLAPGMRGFIEYGGKEMQMAGTEEDADSHDFLLPEEALNAEEFKVYAIDRDGNKSKPKTLYTLEGIVVEKNPN